MFLYLLNMEKANMFKVGIATNFSRIKQHLNTYKDLIDLKKSYMINAKDNSTIILFEKQILEDYKEYKITEKLFKNKDGYTELLKINVLDSVLEDINYKKDKFPNKKIKIVKNIMQKNENLKINNRLLINHNSDILNLISDVFNGINITNITFKILEINNKFFTKRKKVIDNIQFTCSYENLLLIKKLLKSEIIHKHINSSYIVHKVFECSITHVYNNEYSIKFNKYPRLAKTLDIMNIINRTINDINNYYFYNTNALNEFEKILKNLLNGVYGEVESIFNEIEEYTTCKYKNFIVEFKSYDSLKKFENKLSNKISLDINGQRWGANVIPYIHCNKLTNQIKFYMSYYVDEISEMEYTLNIFYELASRYLG